MKCEIRKQVSPCPCDSYTCNNASDYEIGHAEAHGFTASLSICGECLGMLLSTVPSELLQANAETNKLIVQELLATVEIYKERVQLLEDELSAIKTPVEELLPEDLLTRGLYSNEFYGESPIVKAIEIQNEYDAIAEEKLEIKSECSTVESTTPQSTYIRDELEAMTHSEVKAICIEHKLGCIGTQSALVNKILGV